MSLYLEVLIPIGSNYDAGFVIVFDQFHLFAALASFGAEINESLRRVKAPDVIAMIIAEYGFVIISQQSRCYAGRLDDDHWVRGQKGEV